MRNGPAHCRLSPVSLMPSGPAAEDFMGSPKGVQGSHAMSDSGITLA